MMLLNLQTTNYTYVENLYPKQLFKRCRLSLQFFVHSCPCRSQSHKVSVVDFFLLKLENKQKIIELTTPGLQDQCSNH